MAQVAASADIIDLTGDSDDDGPSPAAALSAATFRPPVPLLSRSPAPWAWNTREWFRGDRFFSTDHRDNEGDLKMLEKLSFGPNIRACFVSTFGCSTDFLQKSLPLDLPTVLVDDYEHTSRPAGIIREGVAWPSLVHLFPPFSDGVHKPNHGQHKGLMHAKFILSLYDDRLRILISSANFDPASYGPMIGQGFYLLDLPARFGATPGQQPPTGLAADLADLVCHMLRVPEGPGAAAEAERLGEFMKGLGRPQGEVMTEVAREAGTAGATALRRFWRTALLQWSDASAAPPFAHLVASVPGVYALSGPDANRFGHHRLRALLAGAPPAAQVAAQVSSVSGVSEAWLREFETSLNIAALTGKNPREAKGAVHPSGSNGLVIVFPSQAAGLDPGRAGSGFLTVKEDVAHCKLLGPRFRELVLPEGAAAYLHSKFFVGCGPPPADGSEVERLWVLCGSHNLSQAAWGTQTNTGFFEVKAYELGVLLLPTPAAAAGAASAAPQLPALNLQSVRLPFLLPAPRYGLGLDGSDCTAPPAGPSGIERRWGAPASALLPRLYAQYCRVDNARRLHRALTMERFGRMGFGDGETLSAQEVADVVRRSAAGQARGSGAGGGGDLLLYRGRSLAQRACSSRGKPTLVLLTLLRRQDGEQQRLLARLLLGDYAELVRGSFGGVWAADASGVSLRAALGPGGDASASASSTAAHDPIEAEHAIFAASWMGVSAFPALIVLEPSSLGGHANLGVAAMQGLGPHALHRSCGADALALAWDRDGLLALLLSMADEGAAAEEAARPMREAQEVEAAAHAAAHAEEARFEAEKVARWIARDFRLVIFGGAEGIELCSPKQPVPTQREDGAGGGGAGAGPGAEELPIRVRGNPSALLRALGAVKAPRGPPKVAICSNQGGATQGKFYEIIRSQGQFKASNYPSFDGLLTALSSTASTAADLLGPSYASACGGVLLLSSLAFRCKPKRNHAGELEPGSWAPEPRGSQQFERPLPQAWPRQGVASASAFSHEWQLPSPKMLERVKEIAGVGGGGDGRGGLQPAADTGVLFVGSCQEDREAAAAALCAYCDAGQLLGHLRYEPQWPADGGGGGGGAAGTWPRG